MRDLSSAIEEGLIYLDVAEPGWENKIDLFTLNMHNDSYCLLAQVGGTTFWDYLGKHHLNSRWAEACGFLFSGGLPTLSQLNGFNIMWVDRIQERVKKKWQQNNK